MEKTIFEQISGTYTLQGDYYLPDLAPYPSFFRSLKRLIRAF